MGQNVHDQIANERPALVKRMTENSSVSGAVMGYLNLFAGLAMKQGKPIEGVTFGTLDLIGDGVFRAQVTFRHIIVRSQEMWAPQTDLEKYAGAKAAYFAKALKLNRSLEKFFIEMVGAIDGYGKAKGIPFPSLEIIDPIVTRDFVLTFRVKRKSLALA